MINDEYRDRFSDSQGILPDLPEMDAGEGHYPVIPKFSELERSRNLQRGHARLIRLAESRVIADGDWPAALQIICEATALALAAERVSLWLYNADRTSLRCWNLYIASTHQHSEGISLPAQDYPVYLSALETVDCLDVTDVYRDPRLQEWTEAYLPSHGISALLDNPIRSQGRTLGVLCIEEVGGPRTWATSEMNFGRWAAALMALALEAKDRRNSELALRRSEQQLRQQTEELSQAFHDLRRVQLQLIQAEKLSILGEMLAGVAHEINNPLGCIQGSLPQAQQGVEELLELVDLYQHHYPEPVAPIKERLASLELEFLREDTIELLRLVKTGADRIMDLSQSLRNFARRDDHPASVDLVDGLKQTLSLLRHRLKSHGGNQAVDVEVRCDRCDQLPPIQCYPSQINQVFTNLLTNAIDALRDREQRAKSQGTAFSPKIQIAIACQGQHLKIDVTDNGTGMDAMTMEQLFKPFFTTKPLGQGTGIGLSIARQIIEETHGGRLSCQSELGQGTTFTIALPLTLPLPP